MLGWAFLVIIITVTMGLKKRKKWYMTALVRKRRRSYFLKTLTDFSIIKVAVKAKFVLNSGWFLIVTL